MDFFVLFLNFYNAVLVSAVQKHKSAIVVSVVQSLSRVRLFETLWTAACQASVLHYLPEFAQTHVIELVMPSNHPILCHPLLPLPSIFPSMRFFSQWVSSSHQVAKKWNFSFSIRPSNEYSGLNSFRMDWLDLLAVLGTLKSLFQHQFKSINSSTLSLLYGPTLTSIHDHWKNHSLD